jgi:hypothetical protein
MERKQDTWLLVRMAAVAISLPYARTTGHRSVREELFPIAFRALCHRQICVPVVQQSNIPEIASSGINPFTIHSGFMFRCGRTKVGYGCLFAQHVACSPHQRRQARTGTHWASSWSTTQSGSECTFASCVSWYAEAIYLAAGYCRMLRYRNSAFPIYLLCTFFKSVLGSAMVIFVDRRMTSTVKVRSGLVLIRSLEVAVSDSCRSPSVRGCAKSGQPQFDVFRRRFGECAMQMNPIAVVVRFEPQGIASEKRRIACCVMFLCKCIAGNQKM